MIRSSALPREYQEVEYIESSGTQYIDLGLQPVANKFYSFELEGQLLSTTGEYDYIYPFGCSDFMAFYLEVRKKVSGSTRVQWRRSGTSAVGAIANDPYKVTYYVDSSGNYALNVNNDIVTGRFEKSDSIPYNIILFGRNASTPTLRGQRIMKFKLYEGSDTLLRNMIPCYRVSDNVIGMYDTVNNVFYTNIGTGVFTKGNNITSTVRSIYKNGESISAIYHGTDLIFEGGLVRE